MKLKYVLGFSVIGLLSLGSVFLSTMTATQELNRDFQIETLLGDKKILDQIPLHTVVRENRNNFSKVTLTSTGVEIKPTLFDERYQLGERELEHRELFRDAPWATIFETDDFLITHEFSSDYMWQSQQQPSVRMAVLNKESSEVEVLNHNLYEITPDMNVWGASNFMIGHQNHLYYIATTEEGQVLVYSFDPYTLSLTYEFSYQFEGQLNDWFTWFATDYEVYAQNYGAEERVLYQLDFDSQALIEVHENAPFSLWNLWTWENLIIYEEENDQGPTGVFKAFDLATETETELQVPSFINPEFLGVWPLTSHSVVDNYFILNYTAETMNPQTQFIAIYDLNTLELIYEGSIALRQDQGLIKDWRVLQGFGVDPF